MDSGVTAWLLTSAALVFLMIPGLAFFYGGMNRSKSVLNMLMMVVGALFIVGILWAIYGYSMAYGSTAGYFVGSDDTVDGLHCFTVRCVELRVENDSVVVLVW